MSRNNSLLVSLVLLLSMAAISSAIERTWDNGGGDGNWNTNTNWSDNTAPLAADIARINMTAGPVFSGQTATVYRVYLEGAGNGTLTMNSGTLNTTNHIFMAALATDIATLNMSGGAINVGATFYVARDSGSNANVNLSGGTITCNVLNLRTNVGAVGTINITGTGTLIINSDANATITPWITSGWIKAYNGLGTVIVVVSNDPNKTTVTAAAPTKAGNPSPARNATKVSTLADLSWVGIIEANSHDVYFGTVSPGTFQTNTTAATFDPGRMNPSTVYYWRIDEVNDLLDPNVFTGDVWSFTTGPVVATIPSPANGAINVSTSSILSWTAGVTAASHDVYFGTADPPAPIDNRDANSYDPGTLANSTTYYWRIDEVEDEENTYTGTVWSFTTESAIKKGPYLIYPGNNTQMTVLWQLPSTQGCTLEWGTNTSYSTGSTATTEYGTDHQHKYTITSLTPGTKYYYRVTTPLTTATGSFQTAPAADATNVKFLAYGDTRSYPASHNAVASAVNTTYAGDPGYQTMMLLSGDWVNADAEADWTEQYFNRAYDSALQMQANIPIQGCMGNHEGSAVYYTKYWPYPYAAARYWSFDYGPAHIVVLDQYPPPTNPSAQYTWLVNDLSGSTKPWKIILLHQPGWCAGGSHGNDLMVQTYIQPLCQQYGVQIVFGGHNHYYSRADVNGVQHVTTGAGGAPFYTATAGQPYVVTYTTNALEFCKVSIDGNSLFCQAVKPDGTVIDQFYVDKEEPDFTFIQATDPQIGWRYNGDNDAKWAETVSKVNLVEPNFLIVTGDLVDNRGVVAQVDLYKSYAAGLNPGIQLYNLPGNHDIGDTPDATSYALWKSRFGYPPDNNNPWYSFARGNNLFIVLDSMVLKSPTGFTDPNKAVEEMNWLTTTLIDANTAGYDNIMVFMHTSLCLTSIAEADQTFNMPLGTGNGPRKQLLDLFHEYGVKAVFSGHAHYNSYVRDGDLEIITTSSCNSSLGTPSTPQGFRFVEVYPGHISHVYRTLASIALLAGDFNGDRVVDEKDLDIFAGYWLENGIWP